MSSTLSVASLVGQHNLISDQVNREQLQTILNELAKTIKTTQGDNNGAVVEFGCYLGTTSLFIRRFLDAANDNREFHVYDSFEGLPPKTQPDASPAGQQFKGGELSVSKKQFLREFQKANLRPPIVHKGWFGDLTASDVPNNIAFAFLDGDFYESIRDSLKLVLPRMQAGSCLIFDDYSREALPGVAQAVREFVPAHKLARITVSHNLGILHL